MSILSRAEYEKLEKEFQYAFDICKPLLSQEAVADVEFYIDHGEIEIAYESLGLSIKAEGVLVPNAARAILFPIGLTLNLKTDAVLRADFWDQIGPLLKPDC